MAEIKNCSWLQRSVDWCEGRPEYAGIRARLYYTAANNIVSWPQYELDDLDRPVSSVLIGDFELKEGAFFYHIDVVPERSQVTSDSQGESYSQSSLNKGTFVHPGIDEAASMLAAYCHNSKNVYIFEDVDGRAHVIGNENFPVKSMVSQDFGQGPTGQTSTTITVEATDKVPNPRYVGKIITEEGEIQFKKKTGSGRP